MRISKPPQPAIRDLPAQRTVAPAFPQTRQRGSDTDPAEVDGGVQDRPLGDGGALLAVDKFPGAREGFGDVVVAVGHRHGQPGILGGQECCSGALVVGEGVQPNLVDASVGEDVNGFGVAGFPGMISNVQAWNYALTTTQVTALYQQIK
jgi:hypothetical protein